MTADHYLTGILTVLLYILALLCVVSLIAVVILTKGIILIPIVVVFGGGWLVAKYCIEESEDEWY